MPKYPIYFDHSVLGFKEHTGIDLDKSYELAADYIIKPSNENVASSTTLQDDNDFQFAVVAGSYEVEMTLFMDGANGGDFKFEITGFDSGIGGLALGLRAGATTQPEIIGQEYNSLAGLSPLTIGTLGGTQTALYLKLVGISTVSDTAKLRWAQGSSHATPTRVLLRSALSYRKIA